MASILEIVLQGEISPDTVIAWLQKSLTDVPEKLTGLEHIQQEFVPFFLNYLRDHTLHLLQNSKSATPSPAKTPSIKKLVKPSNRGKNESRKRQQLFGASPAGDIDEIKNLPSSVFTPDTSIDSPGYVSYNKSERHNHRQGSRSDYASQKFSPRCGSQNSSYAQTPDHQRSKQKFSLGEFFCTPDQGGHGYKKRSPHSSGRRDYFAETSPSPGMSRRSGGRKKQNTSPLVQAKSARCEEEPAPVFCLASNSDFPSMSQDRRSFDRVFSTCDTKTSRVINFSSPDSERTASDASSKSAEMKLKGSYRKLSPAPINQTSTPKPRHNNSGTSVPRQSSSGKLGPRRITPTFVKGESSQPQNAAFLVPIEESSDKKTCEVLPKTEKLGGLQEQKDLFVEEPLQPDRLGNDMLAFVITPTKPALLHSTSVCDTVYASLGEVTHQDKLDLLISLYSQCLDGNLLPNLVVEFYFLVQLLTARCVVEGEELALHNEDLVEENYFSSIHNTVYFAVSIFELQKRLLCFLDRGTLRLLSENQRIATFSPALQQYLEELFSKVEAQKGPAFPRSPIGSVSFQADTDNRRNFPNDKSFHLFKRQRDGFYELIREWEEYHMSPNWNMGEVLGHRIRALVTYRTDLANHIHFARLFQSQLIAMCKGDGSVRTSNDDDNIALLSQLKRTNPEKFKRLQERFIKPLSLGGPCPLPTFPGCQEFFRDFIVLACNPVLNQHLCDTFSAKVLELNDSTFTLTDDDDGVQSSEDNEESELFCSVLLNSRLVAKFLGFVTFLPYQSPDKMPDNVESMYIHIRNKQLPLLDILECLRLAVVTGKLCLTVPWLVEYLSMMDNLAPSLDYFQQVLFLLLYVHRYVWNQLQEELSYTSLMVVTLISWLLENPVFPEGFFFSDLPDDLTDKFQGRYPSLAAVDNRNFVDQSLFYTCCPYIGELKTLLVDFTVGYGSKASAIRKITPISADVPVKKSLNERQLQLQMEENFFHNHPASMKRVVDFAADRTASNFIKKFRAGLLQDSLTEGKEKVLKQLVSQSEGSPTSKIKDKINPVTSRVAQDIQARVRQSVANDTTGYCSLRIYSLMKMLLPDDQDSTVVTMAAQISVRLAEEKIVQWMNKHITVAMYQSELTPEMDKLNKTIQQSSIQADLPSLETTSSVNVNSFQSSSSVVVATTHVDELPHPSEVLIELKDFVKALVMGTKQLSTEGVLNLLSNVKHNLESRQDVLAGVYRSFSQLSVELLILLMLEQRDIYTDDIVDACIAFWMGPLKDNNISLVISGRVIDMIQHSHSKQESWKHYSSLLVRLLTQGLLKASEIQDNFVKIIPNIQDEETLIQCSKCVCVLAETLSQQDNREQLGTCLELLYQKLSGEVTLAELSEGSTLTEVDDAHSDSVDKEKVRSEIAIISAERILKVLGLANNNVLEPQTQSLDQSNTGEMILQS